MDDKPLTTDFDRFEESDFVLELMLDLAENGDETHNDHGQRFNNLQKDH
jgi:hypothetical protein